ncbi:hypothetical protein ATZ36_16645 [Candidatus Endomicrobiellum trichonymphae]|uniref:Uncharacterized protein n=1 Tax=Endomicrobium trichonymphae TaxID=1408204 RepID=A0A1E5IJE1_ENDTX|nr:hypothetical protein ATZ36_16645 [Candidatus Endomicrobium trichonymphae]
MYCRRQALYGKFFARPGKPSSRICPSERSPMSILSKTYLCPTRTFETSFKSFETKKYCPALFFC